MASITRAKISKKFEKLARKKDPFAPLKLWIAANQADPGPPLGIISHNFFNRFRF